MRKLIIMMCLLLSSLAQAQDKRGDVVFRAMHDEMERSRKIKLDNMPSPMFLGYWLSDMQYVSIKSVLGSIVDSRNIPSVTVIGAQSLIGDYKNSSKLDYSGKIISASATIDNDYKSLRNSFWQHTDDVYKHSLKEYQVKMSALKQMQLNEEDRNMADLVRLEPKVLTGEPKKLNLDMEKWNTLTNKLSSVFMEYPRLRNSYIMFGGINRTYYYKTSEGTQLVQSEQYIYISGYAECQDAQGVMMKGNFVEYAFEPDKMPTEEVLLKEVHKLAKRMDDLIDAQPIEEYYCGPVMFVGSAASNLFCNSIVNAQWGLISEKALIESGWFVSPMERRIDRRIMDSKLTIRNLTATKEYNGKTLLGCYDCDAYGVAPEKEMLLVQDGTLKNMMSGHVSTIASKKSSGSERYSISSSDIVTKVVPGTLHITSSDVVKYASMKSKLIALAKADKQKYAYIVFNGASSSPDVFQIDVKNGKEKRVKQTNIQQSQSPMLRRVPYVSKEESVNNVIVYEGIPISIIAPYAIIVSDVEIDVNRMAKEFLPVMENPLLRKK